MGFIYKIYDTRNNMAYIGQTKRAIKTRYAEHLLSAILSKSSSKLHTYIMDNIDFIDIKCICECEDEQLDTLERHYIACYNTLHNGLNSNSGGAGYKEKLDYQQIEWLKDMINDYLDAKLSINGIIIKYKISESFLYKILGIFSAEVSTRDKIEYAHTNKPKALIIYTLKFEPIAKFNSIRQAYKWMQSKRPKIDISNFYRRISAAAVKGSVCLGYRWQFAEHLILDNMEFNTVLDKEKYINGDEVEPNGFGLLIALNDTNDTSEQKNDISSCSICRKNISARAKVCQECFKLTKMNNSYKYRQVPSNIKLSMPLSKDTLSELYPKYTLNSIALACGTSYYSINRLAIKYGIKQPRG